MKTAAAYIRVSTEDQIEYSPDSQLQNIKEYANKNQICLPDEFIFMDEGISGTSTHKRNGFIKMIGMAKQKPKPFDIILLWKFSRFARSREDSVLYKSMLRKELGIEVISISEPIGDDKISILIEALIEAMDEYYSINLSEEVTRGMIEKAKRGEVMCAPPFGYKITDHQFTVIPEEAKVIQFVFQEFLNGHNMVWIAKRLNELGIRTHRGGEIESRTIKYWLSNPVYNGKIRWTPNKKSLSSNSTTLYDNTIISQSSHKKIISNTVFQNTQKKLKEYTIKHTPDSKDKIKFSHWLVGLLKCGVCGRALVNNHGYFVCNSKNKGCCIGCGSISVIQLEHIILDELKKIIDHSLLSLPVAIHHLSDSCSQQRLLKDQLQKLKINLNRIEYAYENQIDSPEEYRMKKIKIIKERQQLQQKIAELHDKPDFQHDNIQKIQAIDILRNPDISIHIKHEIAHSIISKIIKNGNIIEIYYYN